MRSIRSFSIPIIALSIVVCCTLEACAQDQIPVSAPLLTDSAGSTGKVAVDSVFRVIRISAKTGGTGFLHKSGNILTAAHVVGDSDAKDIRIITSRNEKLEIEKIEKDPDIDIALLYPKKPIKASCFAISQKDTLDVGIQVTTWGYPSGYNALNPMLSVGYLSGEDVVQSPTGKRVKRLVINAAFNGGNSGGPLIDVESGEVMGIVASKLAPLPPYILSALEAMKTNSSGVVYTKTLPDGTKEQMVEGQVIQEILQFLRSQTQLVVGHAILPGDIRAFLKKHKLDK